MQRIPTPANPVLTDSEFSCWHGFLTGVHVVLEAIDRQLQTEGITHSYFEVLLALSAAPDEALRMSELADLTSSSRSRLSHAVGRLETRGLVERIEYDADRRGHIARLTDAGRGLIVQAGPTHAAAVRAQLLDRLSEQQFATLGEIAAIMTASAPPPRHLDTVPPAPRGTPALTL